jgi:hypothetical protein
LKSFVPLLPLGSFVPSWRIRSWTGAAAASLVVGAAMCAGACSQGKVVDAGTREQPQGNERVQPTYDDKGKLQKIQYDRNGDGKPDAWGYMDGSRVVRVEVDVNGDGTVDRWEYHSSRDQGSGIGDQGGAQSRAPKAESPAGERVDPTLERIEEATKFDGKVSRKEFFTAGVLARVEEDTDGDGRIDKWETYTDGVLSMMAIDTSGRGTPDRRLVYGADGSLDRIEADPTGSGQFQPIKP